MEQSDRLQSEHENQDTYTEIERQLHWIRLRRGSTVHLLHARKCDIDDVCLICIWQCTCMLPEKPKT